MNREIPRLSPEQVEIVRQRLLTYPPGVSAYAWGSGPHNEGHVDRRSPVLLEDGLGKSIRFRCRSRVVSPIAFLVTREMHAEAKLTSRIPQELGLEPVEYLDRLSRDPAALAELLPEPEAGCD